MIGADAVSLAVLPGTPLAAPAFEIETGVGRDLGRLHAGASLGLARYHDLPGGDRWLRVELTLGPEKRGSS